METARQPHDGPPRSLRERRRLRTRRTIQAQALRLFADKGFQATTIEEIAAAAEMAPRTFFRYFPTKEEVVFWAEYPPTLAGFVAARPDDEPALEALHHGITDGLAAWDQDGERERMLERLRLAFRTPALHPRMRQQQAHWAAELAETLADRLGERPDALEVRAAAAAVAAAVWVAAEEWQAQDGEGDLGALIDQALGTVLGAGGPLRATPTPQEAMSQDLDHA
ncbi:MAG: TetR-family transcriptional regulator [Actinomycetia bacterium]|jgi:AcrR family transcriptional regulator|nr:TetR-family transcriptional regulator [Actinomycetes bacterium]